MFGHKDAVQLTYLGLYALQHRGEESAGIVASDGKKMQVYRGMGLVGDVFDDKKLKKLRGYSALGHVRYSTTGISTDKNIQPFLARHRHKHFALAHNGNFTNTAQLHQELERKGSLFQTTVDSEIILHLLARSDTDDIRTNLTEALSKIEGSYSLILMTDDMLIGARDPHGWRPLCMGMVSGAYVLASETCALDLIEADYVRDVEAGEIIIISEKGMEVFKPFLATQKSMCIFEYIYFARPDSTVFGESVCLMRKRLGRQLARECPAKGDVVMAVPDSGNYAALGFAEESKIPFEMGIVRNHYVGRTFIQPSQGIRDFRVKVKLNPVRQVLGGKRVILIEDSIVRGTTSRVRVRTLREAGAKEIHMRVSCPPLKFPCFYGIDFPTKKELIASGHSIAWIRDFLGLDSLEYLSLEGMLKAMTHDPDSFCTACFEGKYPVKVSKKISKRILEKV